MHIQIPGFKEIHAMNLLLDFNGTIAMDGKISEEIREIMKKLSREYTIYVLTADTNGSAAKELEDMPVLLRTFPSAEAAAEKVRVLRELGEDNCIAIGNGRNDMPMCELAALSIAVVGREGTCSKLLSVTDIFVQTITDALELLQNPNRVIATLRG